MTIDVFLKKNQLQLREKYRDLIKRDITPRVNEIDTNDVMPKDLIQKLVKPPFSLQALSIPKKYGGLEYGEVDVCIIAEEIGYSCPALIPFLEIAQLYSHVILLGGNEEQKERFLSRLVNGEIGCYALTDEGPGSDPVAMKTIAKTTEDGFVINGKKRIITFADISDLFAIFSRREDDKSYSDSICAFIIEKGTPGLNLEKQIKMMGLRGHRSFNLILDNVKVPKENIIEKAGLRLALNVLNTTRISLSFGFIGLARHALEVAMKFAKDRIVRGEPIANHQAIRFPIAEIATEIDAARLLAFRAAKMDENKIKHRKETSMAKYYAGDVMIKSVDLANRVLGGYGADRDYPVEKFIRDAYSWIAAQGTNEVQKLVISRELFRHSK